MAAVAVLSEVFHRLSAGFPPGIHLHEELTATLVALVVFGIVVVVTVIRDATQYSPDSLVRFWATWVAVATIMLWFASGLLYGLLFEIRMRHSVFGFALSRAFVRGILAIVCVWSSATNSDERTTRPFCMPVGSVHANWTYCPPVQPI
jgi:hypothetical protein